MISRLSPRVRVQAAALLVMVCALTSLRLPVRFAKQIAAHPEGGDNAQFVARLEGLRDRLPPDATIGYVCRPGPNCNDYLRNNRHGLLQYALVPQRLDAAEAARHEYVLFDADDPNVVPEPAAQRQWELTADAHNGLKLYRTGVVR